jgi:hypothetical protein
MLFYQIAISHTLSGRVREILNLQKLLDCLKVVLSLEICYLIDEHDQSSSFVVVREVSFDHD